MPVIMRIATIATPAFGDASTMVSAMRAGTREYMKSSAMMRLPTKIRSTLQLI